MWQTLFSIKFTTSPVMSFLSRRSLSPFTASLHATEPCHDLIRHNTKQLLPPHSRGFDDDVAPMMAKRTTAMKAFIVDSQVL